MLVVDAKYIIISGCCSAGFELSKYNVNEAVSSQMVCLVLTNGLQLPVSADVTVSSTGDCNQLFKY